ncbi:pyruvate formate lyase activating enzyme [Mobilisporobacter senegalensis]|uniref:Pyruvate formate lyase activating enzyme n=1 Tax=Mobilisporobacter senegalensis TaxID=1329262 RepID=A0A3N1XZE0_9FIRM|nr:anaerobic ribonucleoside-triphosphate reductase activating protein [Mobilisporobacter senegalensis]ROR31949.1 pyruvate formate lyase activating enzyme [Mobilisporobacter senegalensis]
MQIHGFNKTTLLDYPKHLAATIFLGGCNYRCPFCHNASLVMYPDKQPSIPEEEILSTLFKRKHILEGVCITGGEPTIHKNLPDFIRKIKEIGLKVKLDTNGNNPNMIEYLVAEDLIDYIAMDIKNSLEKYGTTVGILNFNTSKIQDSVSFIMSCGLPYEFRTTVVKELHAPSDFIQIGNWIKGAKSYYLQSYKDSGDILFPGLSSYSKDELYAFKEILTPYVELIELRGID